MSLENRINEGGSDIERGIVAGPYRGMCLDGLDMVDVYVPPRPPEKRVVRKSGAAALQAAREVEERNRGIVTLAELRAMGAVSKPLPRAAY